jgi:hypothetical protein
VLEGYDEEPNKNDYNLAIANFMSITPLALKEVETHLFQYYLDMKSSWTPSDGEFVSIDSPGEIWDHIQSGDEPVVCRREDGDEGIYVSVEGDCDWEVEHGLQIVFKEGKKVCKVGPYDGHLTNSDAFNDESLENVIYRPLA